MNMVVISTSQKLSINLGEPSLTLEIMVVSISHPGPQKRRDPSSWWKMVLVDVVQHLDSGYLNLKKIVKLRPPCHLKR